VVDVVVGGTVVVVGAAETDGAGDE